MEKRRDVKKINIFGLLILCAVLTTLVFCSVFRGNTSRNNVDIDNIAYTADIMTGDVQINSDNFPDKVFREWLLNSENIQGMGSDGVLTEEELLNITSIQYRGQADAMFSDLKGIEYFTSLQQLSVSYNALTTLDLSQNVNLTYVNCSYNKLTSLNVTKLQKLTSFNCEYNYLKELDLSGNPELVSIYCRHNLLESLDFFNNTKLKFIETFDNLLKEIDVSMLSELEFLHIDHNKLTKLDMSHNLKLQGGGFVVRNNDVRELILPNIPGFTVYYDDFAEQDPITGYERLEWYADPEYTIPIVGDVQAEGQTLYGKRLPNDYTIKFQGSGSGYPSSISAQYDSYAVLPQQIPTRTGYVFKGWCKDMYGKDTVYQAEDSVLNIGGKINGGSVTLYAQWQPIVYTIEFSPNAQDTQGSMESIYAEYGKSYVLPSNAFLREGYDFTGWAKTPTGKAVYNDSQSVQNLSYNQDEKVVLYAVWELNAEETQRPYLEKLKYEYDKTSQSEYFPEDRDSISELYNSAYNAVKGAEKDKNVMQKAIDFFIAGVKEIPTEQQRTDEIVKGWSDEFEEILSALDDQLVSKEKAAEYLNMARSALDKAAVEKITGYSSLTDSENKILAAEKALAIIQDDTAKLQRYLPSGEWLVKALGYTDLPYSQILPTHYDIYYGLLQEYVSLDEWQQKKCDAAVVEDIKARLDICQAKESALNSLAVRFGGYAESDYSSEQWANLKNLYDAYVSKINSSASNEEIEENLLLGTKAFEEVPTKDEESALNPDDGTVDSGDNGNSGDLGANGNNNNLLLGITLGVILIVLILFVAIAVILRLRHEKNKDKSDD